MVRLEQDGIDDRGKGIGLSLEGAPVLTLDLVGPMGDVAEELTDVLLDPGLGSEAGAGRSPSSRILDWYPEHSYHGRPEQPQWNRSVQWTGAVDPWDELGSPYRRMNLHR